jgi:death-on-curing protein
MFYVMIKASKKVGNSQRIILDAPLIEMVHLNVGDEMHVTVHEGGSITFTPLRPVISLNAAAEVLASDGGATGLRKLGLLESTVAVLQATRSGKPVLKDTIGMAAAYLFYLCRNHPFVDGNQRTALAICMVFLSENGLLENEALDVGLWEALTLDVAAS